MQGTQPPIRAGKRRFVRRRGEGGLERATASQCRANNRCEGPGSNGEISMNKLELVDHISTEAELTKVSAAAALEAMLEGIVKTLRKGEEVRLVGFGTFSVRERAAGKGRNPATGKEIKIAASKNARFKPGAALKASLNKKTGKK
jgi:DNA-binding protein HU-beta